MTHVSRGKPEDRLVSVAIGDDCPGFRLLGHLRNVHRLVVEADRQLAQLTTSSGNRWTAGSTTNTFARRSLGRPSFTP